MAWKRRLRYWPFVRESVGHRLISCTKYGALMFSAMSSWTNPWTHSRVTVGLIRWIAHETALYCVPIAMRKMMLTCNLCRYFPVIHVHRIKLTMKLLAIFIIMHGSISAVWWLWYLIIHNQAKMKMKNFCSVTLSCTVINNKEGWTVPAWYWSNTFPQE